jgi:phytoene dehydrogenase-like protein
MRHEDDDRGVAVVGGGLAGLAAAAWLARAGRRVTVYERASAIGGRAATLEREGYSLNQGPHALYAGGPGSAVLRELGVRPAGRKARADGGFALHDGRLSTLPVGLISLLTTDLLRLPGKLQVARLLARLPRLDPSGLDHETLAAWLARSVGDPVARRYVEAFVRVATYANAPDRLSAGAALAQLRLAAGTGVLYLDGGWGRLVDALAAKARDAGATIVTHARVRAVDVVAGAARGLVLDDGSRVAAGAVLVAGSPGLLRALAGAHAPEAAEWEARATPLTTACLDVALARLPEPRHLFALGVDRPLYLSVHSATASLAPPGGAVIHVAKYLEPGQSDDPEATRAELEALLERLQPGYRDVLVLQRFLPSMTTSHALPAAADGGLAGRPGPRVRSVRGLFAAGDWVGPEGQLADASLASARAAATAMIQAEPAAERRAA